MKRVTNRGPMLPNIDLQDARHGWFIRVYAVESAPDRVFRAAVLQSLFALCPQTVSTCVMQILHQVFLSMIKK